MTEPEQLDPVEALERIAFLLEHALEPTYRIRAFRGAAETIKPLSRDELDTRARTGRLRELPGVGEKTEQVILQALRGEVPAYLRRLEDSAPDPTEGPGAAIRAALRGDCHTHSDWSDGGSPIEDMARAARALGHEYMALTDHSPRLTIAHGLTADRLRQQLDILEVINRDLDPFRILKGIEVDILDDGSLDQDGELLAELDVVVASVHSGLAGKMPAPQMTARMVAAVENPLTDILGHCTGRMVRGKGRAESPFDAERVFATAIEHDKAVEINCRPERLDPPRRLLALALDMGCKFSIDTDAHAPGQLGWQPHGCDRAAETGVPPDRIVNTLGADDLLAWTESHGD